MDPLEIVQTTADAAYATDERQRIIIWNRAAERLLGYKAESVLGKPCYEITCGSDLFGNRFCDRNCTITSMVRRRDPVRSFEIDVRKASGETLRAVYSILTVPGPRASQFTMIHLLQPAAVRNEADEFLQRVLAGARGMEAGVMRSDPPPGEQPALTSREVEVLRMLAGGAPTREIADSLFISVATVRTHIQNILKKLAVHSQLQAVALAFRNRLI